MEINYFDCFFRAKKEYTRLLEPVCQGWSLTRNELDVLLFLYNNPGLDRAADIVSRRGIAKSHVSLSVGTLEGKKLLTRQADADDRRTIRLLLTEEGKRIADAGRKAQRSFFGRVFAGLTAEEKEMWKAITEKVCDNIGMLDKY